MMGLTIVGATPKNNDDLDFDGDDGNENVAPSSSSSGETPASFHMAQLQRCYVTPIQRRRVLSNATLQIVKR